MGFFSFLSTKKKLTENLDEQLKDEKHKRRKPTEAQRLAYLISGEASQAVTDAPFEHMTHKGQVGMISQSTGLGISAAAQVDLAQIFLPGSPLKAAVGASVSMKGGKHRLVVVERQPEDIGTNPKPFALLNMKGYHGALKVGLDASVGVGYDDMKYDVNGAEAQSFQIEIGASVSAGVSYEGTYLRASDPKPQYFAPGEAALMRTALTNALTVNRGKVTPDWNRETYLSLWTHTGAAGISYKAGASAKLVSREEAKNKDMQMGVGIEASGKLEGTLKAALYRLQTRASHGFLSTQDTTVTFKRVGGKKLQIDASAKLGWGTWNEKEEEEEKKKLESQSRSERAREDYKVKEGDGTKGRFNVDKDGIKVGFEDIGGLGDKTSFTVVDSFSYSTAVWVWDQVDMMHARDGSGYLRGHSVIVETLHAYYLAYPPAAPRAPAPASGRQRRGAMVRLGNSGTKKGSTMHEVDTHVRALAKSLHVPLGYLVAFFDAHAEKIAPYVAACVEAKKGGEESKVDDAVILEAAFGVDLRAVNRAFASARAGRWAKKAAEEMPDFRGEYEKILEGEDETYGNVQAIRMRVQRHKEKNKDESAFSVGLKLKVTSLSFSVDIVNRFASGATTTLAQTWLGEHVSHAGDSIPRGAVQPAVLFF